MTGAAALFDLDHDHILVAVDAHLEDASCGRTSRLFFQRARRERLKYQASPVAMVRASASTFMCATIRTSPEPASVEQVTRPSASNLGVNAKPSSKSGAVPGGANDMLSDIAVVHSLDWTARRRALAAPCQYLYNL